MRLPESDSKAAAVVTALFLLSIVSLVGLIVVTRGFIILVILGAVMIAGVYSFAQEIISDKRDGINRGNRPL